MTLIFVMLKVLVFALCAGAIVSVIVFVPLGLYVIPYALWVGVSRLWVDRRTNSKRAKMYSAPQRTRQNSIKHG